MAEEVDQAAAALITQQDAERVSAARMRQLFQGDFYEEMRTHLESCLGRNYYANVDQDMFPEQSPNFVYPLIRAFRDAQYVVAAVFLGRWSSEGGAGGSVVLHVVPPSISSREAERRYRVRWGTKNYNNWTTSRDALYTFIRNDAARILLGQNADLNLLSVGEEVSWIPDLRQGRQEFEAARQGYPHLKQLTVWALRISKPSAEMSVFFGRGARRYESSMIDWARFGTSKLCDAMALAVPHALRCRLLEERDKSQNPVGERFRILPNEIKPLSKEAFEAKYEEAHRAMAEVADRGQLEESIRQERAEIRRRRKMQETRRSSECSSPRRSSDGDRGEVEIKRGRSSARNQPEMNTCTTNSMRSPVISDSVTPGTAIMPSTTAASINPTSSVFTTTSTRTTSSTSSSQTIAHTQVVPPNHAIRVHFQQEGNGSSQTISTDPSRSMFPGSTQSSNASPANTAAVPAQPRNSNQGVMDDFGKSNEGMRNDFGIQDEEVDEEEAGQIQGVQPLLRVPGGARLPAPLRNPPTTPLSPAIYHLPTGSISTYLQPRYMSEQIQNIQATKAKPSVLWGTKDQVNRNPASVNTTLTPYVPPVAMTHSAKPTYYNPADEINRVYVPTPIYTPTTTATEVLQTLSQIQTQNITNGSQIVQNPLSRENNQPEPAEPPNITPAAAASLPVEIIECYSPTSPAYEPANVSMDDLDYEPENHPHASPEKQHHVSPEKQNPIEIRTEPTFSPESQSAEMHSSSEDENDPAQSQADLIKELGEKRFKKMAKIFQTKPNEFNYQYMKTERKQRKQNLPGSTYKGEEGREKR